MAKPSPQKPKAPPLFSEGDLADLAARAATLDERLSGTVRFATQTGSAPHPLPLWAAWRKAAANDDAARFADRLAWDGLDEASARRLMGPVAWPEDQPRPGWTVTLAAALQTFSQAPLQTDPKPQALAFVELVQPFVGVARHRLAATAGASYHTLNEAAHASLAHPLYCTLAEIAHPVFSLKWTLLEAQHSPFQRNDDTRSASPRQRHPARYQRFLADMHAGGLVAILSDYPVLARLLATATDLWVAAQAEFLGRLAEDQAAIQALFQRDVPLGVVVEVQSQLSDRHNGGRGVIACTFASGLKLIYKPRTVGLEAFYTEVLKWINAQGVLLPLKTLDLLDRTTYGWVEFARSSPCHDEAAAGRYYRRMGLLLGLLHVLHGTDCHHGNLIACGEHPVLIDAEMLAVPRLREPSPKQPLTRAAEALKTETLLQVGFLPRWERGPADLFFDISALLGGHPAYQGAPAGGPPTPDAPHSFRTSRDSDSVHLPSLHGAPLDAHDFMDEIVAGFEEMYLFLEGQRTALEDPNGPLAALARQQVRVIFRETSTYARLLRTALQPKFLRDGMAHSIHLEQMARGYRSADGSPPFNWPMLAAERQDLARLDVPYFSTRADDEALVLRTGLRIASCFEASSLSRIRQRIASLGEADRKRQTQILRSAMAVHRMAHDEPALPLQPSASPSEALKPMTPGALIEEAHAIARGLIARSVPLADARRVWLVSESLPPGHHRRLAPAGLGLYTGHAGIALFFGAMAHVTGNAAYRTAAYQALALVRETLDSPGTDVVRRIGLGAGEGLGGILYTLTRLHLLLDDTALLEAAHHAAALVTPQRIAETARLDVLSGSAGMILGLLALYDTTAVATVLARATACGDHLLEARRAAPSGHRVWETPTPGRWLTGMSHGAAGIAYALLRLHAATHETRFLHAAQEALAYERAVFDAEAGNWPYFRADGEPSFWTTWCHGAPGIGLARLGCAGMADEGWRGEVEVALESTARYGFGTTDHLCCGHFGRVELYLEAAQQLERPALLKAARQQAAVCVTAARRRGHYRCPALYAGNDYAPSFFRGRAGIGYQLLRLAHPEAVPSVLRWA